jgi:hypothetical protein
MNIRMTATVPLAAAGVSANMWVGQNDCTDLTRRSLTNYQCEQITTASPPGNGDFNLQGDASQFKKIEPIYIPIPAESLVNPLPVGTSGWPWSCDVSGTQNRTISVLIGPDPNMASCQLPVTVMMDRPATPTNVGVSPGNGALSVNWTLADGVTGIAYYQLLCRKVAQPTVSAMSADFLANTRHWFSACVDGQLHRRPLPGIDKNKVIPAATTPWVADGGATDDGGVSDGGTGTSNFPLDPKFICSDRINPTGSSLSARIDGLDNYAPYEVAVVAIDAYGNGAVSESQVGLPRPTESPLQPFCDSNGGVCPTGFGCQMTTAPIGAGALGLLGIGSGLLVLRKRRRRSSAAGRLA